QALALFDSPDAGIVDPQAKLLFGHHPAWHQRVYTDAVRAETTREAARQSLNGGFGCRVDRHPALLDHPADRAEIDDRTAAKGAHVRRNSLSGKELMA